MRIERVDGPVSQQRVDKTARCAHSFSEITSDGDRSAGDFRQPTDEIREGLLGLIRA
ncbi:hypothetical protein D3C86_2166280 [compost metagenome]